MTETTAPLLPDGSSPPPPLLRYYAAARQIFREKVYEFYGLDNPQSPENTYFFHRAGRVANLMNQAIHDAMYHDSVDLGLLEEKCSNAFHNPHRLIIDGEFSEDELADMSYSEIFVRNLELWMRDGLWVEWDERLSGLKTVVVSVSPARGAVELRDLKEPTLHRKHLDYRLL